MCSGVFVLPVYLCAPSVNTLRTLIVFVCSCLADFTQQCIRNGLCYSFFSFVLIMCLMKFAKEWALLDPPSAYRMVWVLGQNHRGVHRWERTLDMLSFHKICASLKGDEEKEKTHLIACWCLKCFLLFPHLRLGSLRK